MNDETNRIKEEMEKWENGELKKALAKCKEREGIKVKRLYTPLDLEGFSYCEEVGFPGQYPFTRGIQPTMYRGRFWTMRSYSGFGSAEETNKRYKYLLSQGVTGLSVAFDLPTQIGYDSDHHFAEGEVGKVGVAIDSVKDMEDLFEGIPLGRVSTSMTINAPAAVLLAMYQAVAEKQGFKASELNGTIQNDVLKEYLARGTYIYPPGPTMRLATNLFEHCSQNIPKWNSISIGAYHLREAGANAAQEIAFSFANAIAYIEAAIEAGLNIDDFAPRISWVYTVDMNVLEEVAKFRAARRLWAKILKERFGAKDPRSCMLRIHCQPSGSILTAQQPLNNVIRVALMTLGAVLGGVNSMQTPAYDEALALPTEETATLALRTQQIVAYESGAADTVDPLGGSYYIEALTKQLYEQAEAYLAKIDAIGGAVKGIESGYIQQEIQNSAYDYQLAIEKGAKTIVGVNKFKTHYDPPKNLLKVDPALRERQIAKLKELKATRDNGKVQETLAKLKAAAEGTDNLYPPILEAVKAYATLGEICDTLRDVFGEYTPPQVL